MNKLTELMKKAVFKAALFTETVRGELQIKDTLRKEDRTPVTIADLGAQIIVVDTILQGMPTVKFVAEEELSLIHEDVVLKRRLSHFFEKCNFNEVWERFLRKERVADFPVDGEAFIALDPIDGTKGFLKRDDGQYAIAVAYIDERGNVKCSTLGCPALKVAGRRGAVFYAKRNGGAFFQTDEFTAPVKIRSGEMKKRFTMSAEHGNLVMNRRIAERTGITEEPLKLDSQVKYAVVAMGEAVLYVRTPSDGNYKEKIWDHAAGTLIVEETGGSVTDITGKNLDFRSGSTLKNNNGIIVSKGISHKKVVEVSSKYF